MVPGKGLRDTVEKIFDITFPEIGNSEQPKLIITQYAWDYILAGLPPAIGPSSTVSDYYKHLRRRNEISIINQVQAFIISNVELIFCPSTAAYVRNVIASQTIERYVTGIHSRITWPCDPKTGKPACFVPERFVRPVYTSSTRDALVEHVLSGSAALRYLQRFPKRPVADACVVSGPVTTPADFFGPGCALLERSDNGSSIMTAVVDTLSELAPAGHSLEEMGAIGQRRIPEAGERLICQLSDYYGRAVYPHETVVDPLLALSDRTDAYAKECESLVSKMDQMCGCAAGLVRATGLAKALLAVARAGVPESFRAHIPAKLSEEDTAQIKENLDSFCALVYLTTLFEAGSRSLPRVDTGDHERDAAGRELHEKCCRAAHLTVAQMVRAVISACGEYDGPMHRANHAQGAAANMTRSLVNTLDEFVAKLGEAAVAVSNEAGLQRAIGSMPPVVLNPAQVTAYQSICGPDTTPPSSLKTIVTVVRRALVYKTF